MDRFENTRQPDWDWWGRLWPTPGETLRRLGLESGDAVAEVGSGNGYFALPAARIAAPAPVYAIDLEASLLEELADLARLQALENLEPVRADARDLSSVLADPVDVVLIANTFHGVDDPVGLLEGSPHDDGGPLDEIQFVVAPERPRSTQVLLGVPPNHLSGFLGPGLGGLCIR
ncbi:class I SAM-dependent methyltransferase [Natrialbaceae archaeon A-gly3]